MNDIELLTKSVDDAFYVKVDVETYGRLLDIDYMEEGYTKWVTSSRDNKNNRETVCVVDKNDANHTNAWITSYGCCYHNTPTCKGLNRSRTVRPPTVCTCT